MRIMPALIALIGFLIVAGAYFWGTRSSALEKNGMVTIRDQKIPIEIRDNAITRSQGLSGRTEFSHGTGMLFIFPKPGDYGFWMKDMKFPIDIVWIEGGKIVGFSEHLAPEPEKSLLTLTVYRPPQPVTYVLEVPAGTVQKKGFQVGDVVSF